MTDEKDRKNLKLPPEIHKKLKRLSVEREETMVETVDRLIEQDAKELVIVSESEKLQVTKKPGEMARLTFKN